MDVEIVNIDRWCQLIVDDWDEWLISTMISVVIVIISGIISGITSGKIYFIYAYASKRSRRFSYGMMGNYISSSGLITHPYHTISQHNQISEGASGGYGKANNFISVGI